MSEDADLIRKSDEMDALILAAEKYAAKYEDDPREDIKADVMNAFFAGAKYADQQEKKNV